MKIERRITFVVGCDGFAGWKVKRLKTLASYFRAVVVLKNITSMLSCNAEQTLQVMSLGCKKNNLCQLWIEGSDAELACMVLTDFIANEFDIVNTSHQTKSYKKHQKGKGIDSELELLNHASFALNFPINFCYQLIDIPDNSNTLSKSVADKLGLKARVLTSLSKLIDQGRCKQLEQAFNDRENVSSTAIGRGIALPHLIVDGIDSATLAVIRLNTPIDWNSPLGDIVCVIAMVLPSSPSKNELIAFTQLSKSLINEEFCQLLTKVDEPEAIKAILLHTMSKDIVKDTTTDFISFPCSPRGNDPW